jgi:hypothetical protein
LNCSHSLKKISFRKAGWEQHQAMSLDALLLNDLFVTLYLIRDLEDKDDEEEEAAPVRYLAIEKISEGQLESC